ncbi:very short patch repair endonuclease [Paenarthrobacter sp. PH39-S1]|uniref:very short patch repair endonuclease n=1 Tax=Paenarthrobacter sp. PH39-S1 TaxID=3046204 RepID=UPI0024B8FC24|nr:very short patch repair endonuclease [Paenarthrobacter sp. PH39-S1]MDJ0354676.1 very short patch repair endonuclease [Paenarthrobacter sp. PH39-S1]
MAERISPAQRSANMSRIRGKDTKPELLVRRMLHGAGFRYRLHGRYRSERLPGRPDLVFAGRRKVIFVNGCFWHTHSCAAGQHAPQNNAEFWADKRRRTVERDARQLISLRAQGWQVLVVWECELKDASMLESRLIGFLGSDPKVPPRPFQPPPHPN